MSVIDELLKANSGVRERPSTVVPCRCLRRRRLAIVTCMDAQNHPVPALGLEEGDAHVIRNAGGRARDALRSLVISQRLLGTNEIAVIHHTDCGMLTFTNPDLHAKVKKDLGADCDDDRLPAVLGHRRERA